MAVSDKRALIEMALTFLVPLIPARVKLGQWLSWKRLHMHRHSSSTEK